MTTALIDIENQDKDVLGNSSGKTNSGGKSPFKVLKATENSMIMASEKDNVNSQESNANAVKQKSRMPRPKPLNIINQSKLKSKTNVN